MPVLENKNVRFRIERVNRKWKCKKATFPLATWICCMIDFFSIYSSALDAKSPIFIFNHYMRVYSVVCFVFCVYVCFFLQFSLNWKCININRIGANASFSIILNYASININPQRIFAVKTRTEKKMRDFFCQSWIL